MQTQGHDFVGRECGKSLELNLNASRAAGAEHGSQGDQSRLQLSLLTMGTSM